jgi:hypothetical protein
LKLNFQLIPTQVFIFLGRRWERILSREHSLPT